MNKKSADKIRNSVAIALIQIVVLPVGISHAADAGWSLVPYTGVSLLDDQSADFSGATGIADGRAEVSVSTGFTAGLGIRYSYPDSRWTSEFGWEYRSNDSETTSASGVLLPEGNYASNIFYLNGRYALQERAAVIPWVGAGLTWIQEVDLDSEDAQGERSFSASGGVGFQAMAGIDYPLTDRLYLTGELRYTSHNGMDLAEETGSGEVIDIAYRPLTLGIGLGYRF